MIRLYLLIWYVLICPNSRLHVFRLTLTVSHVPAPSSHLPQAPCSTSVQPTELSWWPDVRMICPIGNFCPAGTCARHSCWRPGPAASSRDLDTAPWLRSKSGPTVFTMTSTYTHHNSLLPNTFERQQQTTEASCFRSSVQLSISPSITLKHASHLSSDPNWPKSY